MFTGRRHECLADCGLLRMAVIGQKQSSDLPYSGRVYSNLDAPNSAIPHNGDGEWAWNTINLSVTDGILIRLTNLVTCLAFAR